MTSDKLKALRETLQREAPSALAELEEFRTNAIARIHRLSDALEEIVQRWEGCDDCDCDPDDGDVCDFHIAKRALEEKP